MAGIGPPQPPIGGYHLQLGDAVGGQPVPAAEPAQPAAEGVAGDAYVGRRPGQRRQPGRGRGPGDVEPDGEISLVASLSAPLGEALRARSRTTHGASQAAPDPGLLLFDTEATLTSADDRASAWLAELPPGGPSTPTDCGVRLPIWMQALVFRAAAAMHGHGDGTARARLRTRGGAWLVCHASCLHSAGGHIEQVAVVIEPATTTEIIPIVIEAYGLSEREQQVTRLVARGADTRGIATQLHLSAYTVQDYLKTIFRKVDVSSRGELVAKIFAEHYEPIHTGDVTRLALHDQ